MRTGYILCTTPRSGSTLLCTLLASTGQAGRPDSFYHRAAFMAEWATAWGLPDAAALSPAAYDAAYLTAAIAAGRGDTGVFGMRLQYDYLAPLVDLLARLDPGPGSAAARLAHAFGPVRYLHLMRGDKLAQAISLVTAQQSGLWHRNPDGSERERLAPPAAPVYDADALGAALAGLTRADRAWEAWFAQQRIEPVRISYEALASQPHAVVADIFAALGIPAADLATIAPGVARLADTVSAQWAARYRAERDVADPG